MAQPRRGGSAQRRGGRSDRRGSQRASEERLGALLSSLRDIVLVRDADGIVTYASPSCTEVLGYQPAELLGNRKAALLHMTHIWDQELAQSGVRVISLDPGDMDTAMHAAAIPDADRAALKRPAVAAREIADAIAQVAATRATEDA